MVGSIYGEHLPLRLHKTWSFEQELNLRNQQAVKIYMADDEKPEVIIDAAAKWERILPLWLSVSIHYGKHANPK
jgi:hypothetical protein